MKKLALSHQGLSAMAILLVLVLAGCSFIPGPRRTASNHNDQWLQDGLIMVSRPLPKVSMPSPRDMHALLPLHAAQSETWLSINRISKTINLMQGNQRLSVAEAQEGVDELAPGVYQLLHKQRNALWYAPDVYFSHRRLMIPPQGDRSRFRRGALGDFVLFINKDTPIHSGPVWLDEIGGVRLREEELSKLYYQLSVGAVVEIK